MAGKSTLNRLELTPVGADKDSRYKKITCRTRDVERLFVSLFLQAHARPPERIVLDLDATDDPIHGHQLGRFFHAYYKGYCYLPLYIFCGDHLSAPTCAPPTSTPARVGEAPESDRGELREAWPAVKIVVRADSGFCREQLLRWCEDHGVDYVIGLAKNTRLTAAIAAEAERARQQFEATKQPARSFAELRYQTLKTWSRERRVVAKAEHLAKGANPRFVVTSLSIEDRAAQPLYERDYCGRGEMENRIKEQQLHLFADRTAPDDACQPDPVVLLVDRVRVAGGVAPAGAGGHGAGRGAVPDDPVEAAEDRGVGVRDGEEGLGEVVERQSVRRGLPAGAREPRPAASADAAMLN